MTILPPSPFLSSVSAERAAAASSLPVSPGEAAAEPSRFVLDEDAFLNDIEPLPAFLSAPSQSFLRAIEMIPMLRVLAGLHP